MNQLAKLSGGRLGEKAIRHYRERGYVIPAYRLPAKLLGELRDACDRVIAANPETRPEYLMNPHLMQWPGADNPFMEAASHAAILDMVEAIVLDQHMSTMEGSIGALPRRVMIHDDDAMAARRLLEQADVDYVGRG